jgi:hypothetical protein
MKKKKKENLKAKWLYSSVHFPMNVLGGPQRRFGSDASLSGQDHEEA